MSGVAFAVRPAGVEDAAAVLDVVRTAFAARPPLDPPADALAETEAGIAARLAAGGGLVAEVDGRAVGTVLLDRQDDVVWLRRFGVLPEHRGAGIASGLVDAAVDAVREGHPDVAALAVVAREELPRTVRFWEAHGFREVGRAAPLVHLRRPLRLERRGVPTAESMRELGRELAGRLGRGDLVVLTGDLGAGKTTLTQGLGEGLGVRGGVTSPTFVIARVHPSLADGPALVHVDAYRLGGVAELDDLDLDTSLDDAVTVVEWGEGLAEGLAESRLEVRIVRPAVAPGDDGLDPRIVEVLGVGPRWADVDLGRAAPADA
ncbi:tRNA (adenosine(37)-N6)-threonylcarbamoyltransferase complex ATPase subunit type 1 TsaE [Nocardioides sp. TRM66260-LWL]|uniref:tRNA (adenosine(37)-N6)-threonylcarbamoyltransferase complex ATPase subunit type 1 TsaE n=1 Tax=Nocardioides sp. TRM66260-LWL TaxID=2874478 RepID=UPI001CC5D477|nr:tRNA (adenosine(37)-N6)-threonylcarbamoyltransferase complex ATPase subunit type 1 TsaE [Nocardioides sp. TRM66260-LWL]MBZ5736082.1 tRNA (adenosine(37)-N6)-threonylcarbamoyltransferase complex ATPase subunit type 1 TsaE [Nocardioides sp. TRM66260-LWL]